MEKIKASAIKYRLVSDPENDRIVHAFAHEYCRDYFRAAEIYERDRIMDAEVEGFLTTSDRFVDRYEAYEIALNAGQIEVPNDNHILKSYNVKYCTA